jgi:hypothetical protein
MYLPALDFLKLDVEGLEVFALEGAQKAIERYHPVVLVEQKQQTARYAEWDAAGKWLEARGYELHSRHNKDYIYT